MGVIYPNFKPNKYFPTTTILFYVFLTVHHSIDLSKYQLIAHSLNIQQYKLHYTPQHVSSSALLIIRRTNCITTTSGIVTLEIGERSYINNTAGLSLLIYDRSPISRVNDTRGCGDTIGPPDDEQRAARNMLRSVM